MATEWWQAVTMTLLYTAQFERLDDALVQRRATALLEEPVADFSPEDEHRAISDALRSDATLTEAIPEPHGEDEFRDFLQRLLDRMDAMRPWQNPPHRALSTSRWNDYRNARVVGRVRKRYGDIQSKINYIFRSVQDGGRKIRVVVLLLRSGDEVALAAPWWAGAEDVAVLTQGYARTAEDVMAALVDGTQLTSEEIEVVHGNDRPDVATGQHHR